MAKGVEKEYRALRDFHYGDKHYQIGRAYRGGDVKTLLEAGLIEVGEGHDEPSKFELKFAGMFRKAKDLKQAQQKEA